MSTHLICFRHQKNRTKTKQEDEEGEEIQWNGFIYVRTFRVGWMLSQRISHLVISRNHSDISYDLYHVSHVVLPMNDGVVNRIRRRMMKMMMIDLIVSVSVAVLRVNSIYDWIDVLVAYLLYVYFLTVIQICIVCCIVLYYVLSWIAYFKRV